MRIACSAHRISDKGQGYARQIATTVERILTNARHAIGDHNIRQTVATAERIIANTRYAVGKDDSGQRVAPIERILADIGSARDDNRFQG